MRTVFAIAMAIVLGPQAQAQGVTASPAEVLKFREAPPARRGPATAAKEAPISADLHQPCTEGKAPRQTLPDYPWENYQPDSANYQTEGTFCTTCLNHPIRELPLVDQRCAILRATQQAAKGNP